MDLNFSAFQEPRGVMRIIQFVFSICAFATMCNYLEYIKISCNVAYKYPIEYPFNIHLSEEMNPGMNSTCHPRVSIYGDFSSDARFFVATGVIAMLYCLLAILLYAKFDNLYRTNIKIPLGDFLLSVFIAVLWLSSSASWANALSGLKHVTDEKNIRWDNTSVNCNGCPVSIGSFSSLNIAVILGFLNFFLWAADLWFLYKETVWFQNPQVQSPAV